MQVGKVFFVGNIVLGGCGEKLSVVPGRHDVFSALGFGGMRGEGFIGWMLLGCC